MTEIASEAGHWYLPCGTPFYTIVGKNGKERPVTLRDARPKQAVPSYSMIAGCAAAPALDRWKINQVLLAAAAMPRDPLEGDQAWMDRVLARSKEVSETARDLGTIIHGCIEKQLQGEQYDQTYLDHVEGALTELNEWCGSDGLRSERSFSHPLGYGGKCDVHKEGFIADFKTKEFRKEALPSVYDNHAMQLAAYKEGFNLDSTARCAIIYVSTTEPGLTHLVEIDQDEIERGWNMFQYLLHYWQEKNRYWPTQFVKTLEEELI